MAANQRLKSAALATSFIAKTEDTKPCFVLITSALHLIYCPSSMAYPEQIRGTYTKRCTIVVPYGTKVGPTALLRSHVTQTYFHN